MLTFIDGTIVEGQDSWGGEPAQAGCADVLDPGLRRLFLLWDERKTSLRRFPSPGDIGPRDMLFMLSRIALVEVTRDPLRFYWRVVGGWWRDQFGVEGTGMYVDQWPSEIQRNMLLQSYSQIVSAEAPCRHVRNQTIDGKTAQYEALLLPLGIDDTLTMFLVGVASPY